ncbi:MAG: DUF4150 domain-containing protein, partial [Bdellovibrio bacteriovorus]
MPVTIKVNGTCLSLVHKMSNGISTATIPDVCKTPSPGGPVPIPYPNIAQSITLSDGTTTVKGDKAMAANKGSKFALSNGDQAGTVGGVKSNVFMKEATWILYSFDVKMDGKNACRLTDPMFHNAENAANLGGVLQNPAIAEAIGQELGDEICDAICDARNKADKGKLPSEKFPTLQSYVASKFSSGFPLFTPTKLNLFVEMTWKIARRVGGAFAPIMSATGRLLSNGMPAPGGLFTGLSAGAGAPGTTFRPDFTLLNDASKPASFDNVKKFIEVKFKGDTPTP